MTAVYGKSMRFGASPDVRYVLQRSYRFSPTKMLAKNNNFVAVGMEPKHWSGTNQVREILERVIRWGNS
jgi:hypothetical protein